jgi:hypothetical protein
LHSEPPPRDSLLHYPRPVRAIHITGKTKIVIRPAAERQPNPLPLARGISLSTAPPRFLHLLPSLNASKPLREAVNSTKPSTYGATFMYSLRWAAPAAPPTNSGPATRADIAQNKRKSVIPNVLANDPQNDWTTASRSKRWSIGQYFRQSLVFGFSISLLHFLQMYTPFPLIGNVTSSYAA